MTVDHALQCKNGGLITILHNNVEDEWGTHCTSALTLSAVSHEPLINCSGWLTVTRATAEELEEECMERREEEERQRDGKNLTEIEKEDRGYKGVHSFWWRVAECIFDVQSADSNADKNRW